MNPWDVYESRMNVHGTSKRDAALLREQKFLNSKLPSSLSYHQMTVNGELRSMAVLNSTEINVKKLRSLPGEDFPHGGLVHWADNYWLITEKDANTEVYSRGTMKQCNYLLRWVSEDHKLIERWCIVEDGTKYLIGESTGADSIATKGDMRIALTLARDKYTIQLNRSNRFLIDDYASKNVIAYQLTKPFKLGGSYNGNGILNFVLSECNTEDSDNFKLHVANYYDHFPREDSNPGDTTESDTTNTGRKVWI